MSDFPVDQLLNDEFLNKSFPKLIISSTGSGKSTRLPQFLIKKKKKFILVEPRRVVVKSLYHYLHEVLKVEGIAYQIRFERVIQTSDWGIIVTPGILISYFLHGFPQGFEDAMILLDEFHERQKEIDFILALLKNRSFTKFMLLSATLKVEDLEGYSSFDSYCLTENRFKVDLQYDKGVGFPTHINLETRIYQALKNRDYNSALVFLPGKREIFALQKFLTGKTSKKIYPIYGGQDFDEQDLFLKSKEEKVLLSTNILESSITVDGIDLIVDSGLSKSIQYRYGREVLSLEAISEQSANQRLGRTGRTGDGVCVRLWDKSFRLDEKKVPEILRSDLSDILLKGLKIGVHSDQLSFLDPPKEYQWKDAKLKLSSLGLLDESPSSEIPISFSVETFKIVDELKKSNNSQFLSYYLFMYALAELNLRSSFFEAIEKQELKIPIDLHIYNLEDSKLKELLKRDYGSFKNLLKQYTNDFGCIFDQSMALDERNSFVLRVCNIHKQGMYFHVKRSVFRNAYGVELLLNEEIDTKKYPVCYVLDFFELEDEKRKRKIFGSSYLKMSNTKSEHFPITSLRSKRFFVKNSQAYEEFDKMCGPYILGNESKILQGDSLINYYKAPSILASIIKDMDTFCFYYNLHQDLIPTNSDSKGFKDIETFLYNSLKSFGVTIYEDLFLLEKEDFFESDFLFSLPSLQKQYPMVLDEPGANYQMEYDLKKRKVYFCQIKGSKSPSSLILKKFSKLSCFWKYKGRIISV
ncbi:MAG: hypothetical protein KC646_17280 [Candidatus Cloacimonetes bacterium]|nr:hypothetical protein [Candidatus Cloacimonadota bacterium]